MARAGDAERAAAATASHRSRRRPTGQTAPRLAGPSHIGPRDVPARIGPLRDAFRVAVRPDPAPVVALDRPAGPPRPRHLSGPRGLRARAGCAWRETDETVTDLETILRDLLSGQYAYPVRIVCFNPGEGWSRDATSDVADALAQRVTDSDAEVPSALQDFIAANATRRFDVQLALPLQGAA